LIAVAVLLALVAAFTGSWAVTAAMAFLVAGQLIDIAHERRKAVKRTSRP